LAENPNANIEEYRYPGPKPKSKEMGILMLADIVEATSKSLKNASVEEIKKMIERTITELFEETNSMKQA